MVHSPSASGHPSATAQVMRVVPQITSTSPGESAPATSCSASASTVPAATGASPRKPTGAEPMASSGRRAGSHHWGSQPSVPNTGRQVMAVMASMAAAPHSAWLATAWAGQ